MIRLKLGVRLFAAAMASIAVLQAGWWFGQSEEAVASELDKDAKKKIFVDDIPDCFISRECYMARGNLTFLFGINVTSVGRKFTSVEDATRFHSKIFKIFASRANASRKLRPFFNEFPLTPESFEVVVHFADERGEILRFPYIGTVANDSDRLEVLQQVRRASGWQLEELFVQPIREATELKPFFKPTLPKASATEKIHVPEISDISSIKKVNSSYVAKFGFVNRFAQANDLKIVAIGVVGTTYYDLRAFGFALRGSQKMNLEEAQQLAGSCAKESFHFLQTDQKCLDYLKLRSTRLGEKYPSAIPEPGHIAFRISFWDENVDRQPAPYIAEIRLLDGVMKYFVADEYQRLELVHQETFEEAVSHASEK